MVSDGRRVEAARLCVTAYTVGRDSSRAEWGNERS